MAELLNRRDDDWVTLRGKPDGRPIWLPASHVDYVEVVRRLDDLKGDQFDQWIACLINKTPARCNERGWRHADSGGNWRSYPRAARH